MKQHAHLGFIPLQTKSDVLNVLRAPDVQIQLLQRVLQVSIRSPVKLLAKPVLQDFFVHQQLHYHKFAQKGSTLVVVLPVAHLALLVTNAQFVPKLAAQLEHILQLSQQHALNVQPVLNVQLCLLPQQPAHLENTHCLVPQPVSLKQFKVLSREPSLVLF
jgi:hypothetical protein